MKELGRPSLPILVSFKYKDLAGDIFDRRVNVLKIEMHPSGYLYFEGHCSTANAFRTFKSDWIVQTVPLIDTGEIVGVDDWRARVCGAEKIALAISTQNAMSKQMEAPKTITIMLTGYKKADRESMENLATEAGLAIRKTVSSSLDYLIAGENAGPSKMALAEELGVEVVEIVGGEEFEEWLATEMEA